MKPGDGAEDDSDSAPTRSDRRVASQPSDGDSDGAPTRHERPVSQTEAKQTHAPSRSLSPPSTSGIGSSLAIAEAEQRSRDRKLAFLLMAMATTGFVGLPFLGGDPRMQKVLVAGLVVIILSAAWMRWLITDPARATEARLCASWFVCCVGVCAVLAYFGVFSAAPTVCILAVYFAAHGANLAPALTVYLTCALFQASLSALIVSGTIADPGLFRIRDLSALQLIAAHGLMQMVLLCTFLIARRTRSSMQAAVGEVERIARVAAHREALLQEAREELERALRPDGAGRFSEQVIGSFKLGAVLGRGAMGEVYEAVHSQTGEPAAVKLLRREALGDAALVERFLRESQILKSLDAENVVRVLEAGGLDATLPYIAMERLRGDDLAQHLRTRPRLPPREVLAMLRQVGRGVDAAHRAGVVHRDLKPANIFLHDARTWKVLDFGVSKLRAQDGTLSAGFVVGTPMYMAPEQANGSPVDGRADLHALGVIAFRALTGQLPYRGRDTAEILYNVVHATPPRPTELAPELPPEVDGVMATALAKNPADRFQNAAALVEGLAQALTAS